LLTGSAVELTSIRRQKGGETSTGTTTEYVSVCRESKRYNSTAVASDRAESMSCNLSERRQQQQAGNVGDARKQVVTTIISY